MYDSHPSTATTTQQQGMSHVTTSSSSPPNSRSKPQHQQYSPPTQQQQQNVGLQENPMSLKLTASTLIDFESFAKPKRNNQKLKELKEQLLLYRALDALENRTQDRRTWRRPQTFSIGQSERKTKFDAAVAAAYANALSTDDDGAGGVGTVDSVGPRGIMQALSKAQQTQVKPAYSNASPVPEAPSLSASGSGQHQHHQPNHQSGELNAEGDEQHISEAELKKVRQQFRDLVARQRAEEQAALIPMFEAGKIAEEARSSAGNTGRPATTTTSHASREEAGFSFQQQKDKERKQHFSVTSPKRASSARNVDNNNNTTTTGAFLSMMKSRNEQQQSRPDTAASSSARKPPSTAPTTTFAPAPPPRDVEQKDHLFASRARIFQFNAFKSNGITGTPRGGGSSSVEGGSSSRPATTSTSSKPTNNFYGLSPPQSAAIRPGTASELFKKTHETDKQLEHAENEIKESEREVTDPKHIFPASLRSSVSPRVAEFQQQQRQRGASTASTNKKASSFVVVSGERGDKNVGVAAEDPEIELAANTDPFQFLQDGAENIYAGIAQGGASKKKDYTQTLQEKLLSLAAARAGVSLHAAAAPARVLGTRAPTAEAQEAHQISLEDMEKKHKQKQRQLYQQQRQQRPQRSVSPRTVVSVGTLHGSVASSTSNHHQQNTSNRDAASSFATHLNGNNNNNSSATNVVTTTNPNGVPLSKREEITQGVMKRQEMWKEELEHKRRNLKKGDYCNEAPLPFGRAGPIERHIPSPRIHPLHQNSQRQERSLCDNVHLASRTAGVNYYYPKSQQFEIPYWKKVVSLRGCANAGLAPKPHEW